MLFHIRATKYVLRKMKKSLLLGGIILISVYMCFSGIVMLRVTNEILLEIAKNARASINLSDFDSINTITTLEIEGILSTDNILTVNRMNYVETTLQDYIGMEGEDAIFGMRFFLIGQDDYHTEGVFFVQSKHLVMGTLDLAERDLVISRSMFDMNSWEINTEIPFLDYLGNVQYGRIAGVYQAPVGNVRDDTIFTVYTTTSFVNELQGEELYYMAIFQVEVPSMIQHTREKIEDFPLRYDLFLSTSDGLYRQMSEPIRNARGLTQLMLLIIALVSIGFVTLLLTLWMRERRKEVAILLVVGEGKGEIILQRLTEVYIIFVPMLTIAVLLSSISLPLMGSLIYGNIEIELTNAMKHAYNLVARDIIQIIGICGGIILLSVFISSVSVFRISPKSTLSAID